MQDSWARTIEQVVGQEYPAAMHHEQAGPGHPDPRTLHPAFWGSYDLSLIHI